MISRPAARVSRAILATAFSSYGSYGWLSDLDAWARGIARVLAPGGRFVIVDFHPLAFIFDEKWRLSFPYSGGEPMAIAAGVRDYVRCSATCAGARWCICSATPARTR